MGIGQSPDNVASACCLMGDGQHAGAFGKERVENRLKELLESGVQDKVYEALQLYTSKASRKSSSGDYPGAMEVASEGAVVLVEQGSPEGGLELGNWIIKLATDHETPYGDTKAAILRLDSALASGGHDAHRRRLIKSALAWSVRKGERAFGDKELNLIYGELLWEAGQHEAATGRLVSAEEPSVIASKAMEALSSSPEQAQERDRLLCLAILSFVAIENLRDANRLYDEVQAQLKSRGLPPTGAESSVLLPFCGYVLRTCERDAGPLFELLLRVFESPLQAEPKLKPILTEIGQKYFRMAKPPSLFSMLEGMMGMFG